MQKKDNNDVKDFSPYEKKWLNNGEGEQIKTIRSYDTTSYFK